MRRAAADLGLQLPASPDFPAVAAAIVIIGLTALAAWAIGRFAGPRLAEFWQRKAALQAGALAPRLCAILRYFILWLVLAVVLRAGAWPPLADLLLGLGSAVGAGLTVLHIVRGLGLMRWGAWPLAGFVFLAVLTDSVGGLTPITEALDRVAFTIGTRRLSLLILVQIGVALLALYAVVKVAIHVVANLIRHTSGFDPTQQLLAQKLAAIAIIAIGFFVGIDLAGIDLTALAVFSGALGLAVGFGLQKTFGNLIAGIILLMDRSIKPGDVISVGESFGSVSKIGVRAVSIVTRDGKEYLIPNEILMTQEVVNWSYSTRDVRVSIPVGIGYDCDVKLAQQLMIEAARASPRVLDTPQPVVWMTAFGDNALGHEIRVWIRDPEAGLGSVRSQILGRLWELFRENGIQVPFPQRDVRVKEWPDRSTDEGGSSAR
ncbi:mechanosensitive ion channel family protein [Sphingosinicella terrae]|uniref:mechanosensitive ion channel family protein n=1 Tax=Sphingosinicella terrae TaxID=2172047 RepID=UPI000E0D430A|nr:mechanosensitive ion channel domain-containing protein [Sphingosinicella terrae]